MPVACNVGVFWPRHAILRESGLAVVEFLPRVTSGLGRDEFLRDLKKTIEDQSDRLMTEAGFSGPTK